MNLLSICISTYKNNTECVWYKLCTINYANVDLQSLRMLFVSYLFYKHKNPLDLRLKIAESN